MDILRAGTQPSARGPEAWFTGTVRIDPLFNPFDAERVQGAQVTFEPGARTAWHTHPLGQTLLVISGLGRVQRVPQAWLADVLARIGDTPLSKLEQLLPWNWISARSPLALAS